MPDAIDASLTTAPVIDRGGYAYVIHPLTDGIPRLAPALLRAWTAWAAEQPMLAEATILLAPEAMAIPLATALSLETDIPSLVIRKREYGLDGETVAYCETGYSQSCLYINDIRPNDRIVIIDDMISTGGTLEALLTTLQEMGAEVLGALAFVEKGDRAAELAKKTGVPVQAMRRIHVEDGRVDVSTP